MSKQLSHILAIDPGFDRVGLAVLSGTSSKQTLLYSECIVTKPKDSHGKRLKQIGSRIDEVIKEWAPQHLAIEKLFFNQNTSSVMGVAEARGVIIFQAVRAGLEVFEYSPQDVKMAVTGYGKADKGQVEEMTKKLVEITGGKKLDDEIDAIAIGICHLATARVWD